MSRDAYLLQCSALRDTFNLDAGAVLESDRDVSWAEVATVLEIVHEAYGLLDPPPELGDYHRAAVDFVETYAHVARSHTANQSFVEHYTLFTFAAIPGLVGFAQDESKTEEERMEGVGVFMERMLNEFFGPEFLAAHLRVRQSLDRLNADTRDTLEAAGCPMGNP